MHSLAPRFSKKTSFFREGMRTQQLQVTTVSCK
jgi:hypothetical protein